MPNSDEALFLTNSRNKSALCYIPVSILDKSFFHFLRAVPLRVIVPVTILDRVISCDSLGEVPFYLIVIVLMSDGK